MPVQRGKVKRPAGLWCDGHFEAATSLGSSTGADDACGGMNDAASARLSQFVVVAGR